jgi:tetratricopeptide (TPR) repeat protein
MDEETNIYELLSIAESYKNPNIIKRLCYNTEYLLEKAYEHYTHIINILLYKKEYEKAIDLYSEIFSIIINMNKNKDNMLTGIDKDKINFLAKEYYKLANIKYIVNKESSINSYKCSIFCYENNNNNEEVNKILIKIINIYEELKNNDKIIEYLEKYINNNKDIDITYKIKLGDYYILNDNIIKANKIYEQIYKETNNNIIYIKLLLTKLCLNRDNLSQELYDNTLLYPSLDMIDEIMYIENIINSISSKDREQIYSLIDNNQDKIICILLNIILSYL